MKQNIKLLWAWFLMVLSVIFSITDSSIFIIPFALSIGFIIWSAFEKDEGDTP